MASLRHLLFFPPVAAFLVCSFALAEPRDYQVEALKVFQTMQANRFPKILEPHGNEDLFKFLLVHAGSQNPEAREFFQNYRIRYRIDGSWFSHQNQSDAFFDRGIDHIFSVSEHWAATRQGEVVSELALNFWEKEMAVRLSQEGNLFHFSEALKLWMDNPETRYVYKEELLEAMMLGGERIFAQVLYSYLSPTERERLFSHWVYEAGKQNDWGARIVPLVGERMILEMLPDAAPEYFEYLVSEVETRDALNDKAHFITLRSLQRSPYLHPSFRAYAEAKYAKVYEAREQKLFPEPRPASDAWAACTHWITLLLRF